MRVAYESNRIWFLGALFALPGLSFLQEIAVDGHISGPADTTFKLVFAAVILVTIFNRSDRAQKVLAALGAILVIVYVALLFNALK
jgi:apolipoprotein N-acyltransferase